ncbi:MAG: glutathione transferase [Elainellaceae cyanobacterium]
MSKLKLYVDSQYASPYALSVFVALTEKDLAFEIIEVDLAKNENLSHEFSLISITSRVPVLEHQGFNLSESSAITEYIEETFAGISLYPKLPNKKAQARQIQAWLRSDLMPIKVERSTQVVYYKPSESPLSGAAQQAAQKLFFVSNCFLKNGQDHLFGSWCIADVELSLMLHRLILNGDTVPENLVNYAKSQWLRPSVQKWVNKTRPAL